MLSRVKFLTKRYTTKELIYLRDTMRMGGKLNVRQIRWILRRMHEKKMKVEDIAEQQGVTPQWARKLVVKYKDVPIRNIVLKKPGPKAKPISPEEAENVRRAKETYGLGAVLLEQILAEEGQRMPHNRIHRILLQEGYAKKEPKKSRRRKWVRYERRHSHSLIHTDYFEVDGREVITYEDDASRCILAYGEFAGATTDNAIKVFDEMIRKWEIVPRELISDHGSQFCEDEDKEYRFRKHVQSCGTKHILARVKHPQTNGKQERLGGTIRGIMRWKGCDLAEAVKFYNEVRPHMSLYNGHTRTPLVAYYEKMRTADRNRIAYAEGYAYAKKAAYAARLGLRLDNNLVEK